MLDESLLRRLFADAVERSGAFGAQVSIVKAGEQLDLAVGITDAERGRDMTPDTLMQIGSITKVFNAALILSLVQEGKLDLDAPVTTYLPHLQISHPEALRKLTLRHLLSMSSGLDNGPYIYFGDGNDALGSYVHQLGQLPQHFTPGKHFGYSNAGICIAGHIASHVAGKPWEVLLKERILHPAGLTRSAILDADLRNKLVSFGHSSRSGSNRPTVVEPRCGALRARAPSGPSFALATSELARFAKIFINKGVADTGARILSESSVERMMSPQVETPSRKYGTAWCLGPCTGNWHGTQVFGHGGSTATSSSYLYWIPEHAGAIAFIVNTPTAMGEFSRIAFDEILQVAFGFSRPCIDLPEDSLAPLDRRRYAGTYEELGMRMEVIPGDGDTLRARWIPRPIEGERGANRTEQSAILTPLGEDRFLVNPTGGPDKHRGVVDTAFFGDDGQGRATNVLNLVFPMSRRCD